MKCLTPKQVVAVREQVIEPNGLHGMVSDKSAGAVLARIDNRLVYGMISDVFELAACYACYTAVGHWFNDASKRTAFAAMDICLTVNGIEQNTDTEEAGHMIIRATQSIAGETGPAEWLKGRAA